ncbi:MAG: Uma2 family endonuclease [Cyanobacteria bacterium P01_G01_bin.54]
MPPMTSQISLTSTTLPPLESGDRLSRPEFERRYTADPQVKKAELIEGIVYVASPLRFEQHAQPHNCFATWLGTYAAFTPQVNAGIEPTVQLDLDNEVQPDLVLRIESTVGGQTQLTPEGYLEGAPELVVEIAASSAAIDRGRKQQVYRRSGVKEYLVWQVFEQRLDWWVLVEGEYQQLLPDTEGIIRSRTFPGLWLNRTAFVQGQMPQVLQGVQQGMATPEYAAFAADLAAAP